MEEENKIKKEQHSSDLRRRARLAVMNSKRVLLSSTNDFDENEEEDGPSAKVSEEEDVTVVVDFIGDGLLGARKWLGAATVIDEKTKETTFYGVPSHARRVLKVVAKTGLVSVVGPDLGDRKFKYLRGVTSVDEESEEPTIFALPAWGITC